MYLEYSCLLEIVKTDLLAIADVDVHGAESTREIDTKDFSCIVTPSGSFVLLLLRNERFIILFYS